MLDEDQQEQLTEAVHRIIGDFYTLVFSCAAGSTTYFAFTLAGTGLNEVMTRTIFVTALSAIILHDYIYEGTTMHILKEESEYDTKLEVQNHD